MARVLLAALNNHLITSGTVTGAARAELKRAGDPIAILEDGDTHGPDVEDTEFSFDPSWGGIIGEPGTPHDEWRHPDTNLQMTINPIYWIVEMLIVPPGDEEFEELLDPEYEAIPPPVPGVFQFKLTQKHKFELSRSGTVPNVLTPPELTELTDTHRLRLTRGRALQVFQLRPTPV